MSFTKLHNLSQEQAIKKDKDKDKDNNKNNCNICNSVNCLVIDHKTNEVICNKCGAVVPDSIKQEDNILNYDISDTDNTSLFLESLMEERNIIKTPSALINKGLTTFVSDTNIDANNNYLTSEQKKLAQKLRYTNKVTLSNPKSIFFENRSLLHVYHLLQNLQQKLKLPDSVLERAAQLYRKIIKSKLLKGRNRKAFVVACIYIALREKNITRSLVEIAETVNMDKKQCQQHYRCILKHLYQDINNEQEHHQEQELEKQEKQQQQPSILIPNLELKIKYINKFGNELGLDYKTIKKAIDIMTIIQKYPESSGKNTLALAIGILYYVYINEICEDNLIDDKEDMKNRKTGRPNINHHIITTVIKQKEFVLKAGVSEVTIRSIIKFLKRMLEK
ncbi:MAG: hypothetical protein ACR2F1_07975 [Nitrososphaeraceae archaeon]